MCRGLGHWTHHRTHHELLSLMQVAKGMVMVVSLGGGWHGAQQTEGVVDRVSWGVRQGTDGWLHAGR